MARLSRILDKDGEVVTLKTSKAKCIKLKCLDCVGHIRKNVKDCKDKKCFLYPYRLGKNPHSGKERSKAIKDFCTKCMNGQTYEIKKCTTRYCPIFSHRKGAKKEEENVKVKKLKRVKRMRRRK